MCVYGKCLLFIYKLRAFIRTKFSMLGGHNLLTVTREKIIEQIAQKGDIDVATVRKLMNAIDNTIFDYLSSVAPDQSVEIHLLDGLKIEGHYQPSTFIDRGIFQNINSKEKIKAKAKITSYYNKKLNI